jgi:WD40 repeat protein/serine/threonine protein kinase
VISCPHCKQPLVATDFAGQPCPHCGRQVLSGQATLDVMPGELTIELPGLPTRHDRTFTAEGNITLVDPRHASTIDSADIAVRASAPPLSATIDSADLPASAPDPRLSGTIESADLPPGKSPDARTALDESGLPEATEPHETMDSSIAAESLGSSAQLSRMQVSPPSDRASRAGVGSSGMDDVDRRLHQIWGSQMASSRPQMTMRGSSDGRQREENTTLIIRPRALSRASETAAANLADYDLLGVLGEGGMGVVYNARQASIDREVAVKMLKADMAANPSQRRKFLSEAAVTGELDHPNIVPIYDLGENAEGALFYSMKKVTGTPWSEVIHQNSLLDNLTILMKVADAVAFAHARGVVHRDLKPENVMLGDFGEVLVLDWGLAVATDGHRPTPNVSAAFNIAGTPAYMAPELAFGPMDAIGRHSDVYLLGAILYESITGKPPHSGKNARDCLKAAAHNRIVPTEKRGELVEIALKAMATDPADRHKSVQGFQEAIRSYQAHSESIALCERAEEGLATAAQSSDYQDYSRALFAFEEAVQLWPGNEAAKIGVSRAQLHYASCALGKSDFDLGLSLVSEQDPAHALVRGQLAESKAERDARLERLARARRIMVALAALVFVAVSVGIVVASYLAIIAKESEGRAVSSAELAKENAEKAKRNEDTAVAEAARARQAEDEAKLRREEAVASAYTALIAMAAARIDENAFDQARAALDQCDERYRGWEWRRLAHVVAQGDVTQIAVPSRAETISLNSTGSLIATGSIDGKVRVWDRASRKLIADHASDPHAGRVTAVAFHPTDDRWLVVGASDGPQPLVVWNRETGELRTPADEHRHTAGVVQATFAADGRTLLTASHDRTARLWTWETLVPTVLKGHTGTIWSAALSADGQVAATASDDGTVRLWDASTARELRSAGQRMPFDRHVGPVFSAVFLPGPTSTLPSDRRPAEHEAEAAKKNYYLASAGYDKRVLLWAADQLVPFDFEALLRDQPVPAAAFEELDGHSAAVRALAVSPDGTRLASVAADHTVRVWHTQDTPAVRRGSLLKALRGHAGPVYAAAFLGKDSDALATTGYDDRIRLWSIDQYQEEQFIPGLALRGHSGAVLYAGFAPDGQSVVTASADRTARTWDTHTAAEQRVFRQGHGYLASRAVFFPASRKLLTAGGDGTVRVWDRDKQAELLVLHRTGYRAAAALSPDESLIITGSSQLLSDSDRPHGALLWNAATGERLRSLVGPHKAPVTCVAFSPTADHQLAVTADDNGVFQLWNPATGQPIGPRMDQHASALVAVEFASDERLLVTADAGGHVIRWNVADPAKIVKADEFSHAAGISSIALLPDGKHLLIGGADGLLRLFAAGSQQPLWTAEALPVPASGFVATGTAPVDLIPAVAVGWDAVKQVAVAVAIHSRRQSIEGAGDLDQEFLRLFELDPAGQSYKEVMRRPPARGSVNESAGACLVNLRERGIAGWSAAISADARELATIGRDEARLLARDGSETAAFRSPQDLTFATFSRSGQWIATASLDNSIRVWHAATGRGRLTLDEHSAGPLGGHTAAVNCAAFTSDERYVFTGSDDGTVRKWNLETLRVEAVLPIDSRGVTRLVLSRDEERLVAAGRSGQATVWNLARPEAPVQRLLGHAGEVLDLCVSPDEKWIVTASADNTARIWNAATGVEVVKLAGHASEVTAVAMLADGPGWRVLTGSSDKTAKLWAITELIDAGAKLGRKDGPVVTELLTLKGHGRELTSVAFSPDGRSALTAGRDGLAILWHAAEVDGAR